MRAADRPDKGSPHRILTAAAFAAVQDRVIDLDVSVLNLKRHHVPYMVKLAFVRHQPPAML